MPVQPIDKARGRFLSNHFVTATEELMRPKLLPRPLIANPTHNCQISSAYAGDSKPNYLHLVNVAFLAPNKKVQSHSLPWEQII